MVQYFLADIKNAYNYLALYSACNLCLFLNFKLELKEESFASIEDIKVIVIVILMDIPIEGYYRFFQQLQVRRNKRFYSEVRHFE